MSKREPYFDRRSKALTDTTADYLTFSEVEAGQELYVTAAGVEDETTAPTTLSFGKIKGSSYEVLEEEPNPAVGILVHIEKTHRFMAGDIPAFRVEGLVAGDVISGYIEGYLQKVG